MVIAGSAGVCLVICRGLGLLEKGVMVMVRVRVQPWMRTRLKVEQGQVILGPDLGEGQGQVTLGWVRVRGRLLLGGWRLGAGYSWVGGG